METTEIRVHLRTTVTCPHCWHSFPTAKVNWIATHPELYDDPQLGTDAMQRFLPTRFTASGNAIDRRGMECRDLACPRCHLRLPRAAVELKPCFVSIAGSPSSGKSFFLAAMTWQLRSILPKSFRIEFADADAEFNRVITGYEDQLFYSEQPDELVKLAKTQEAGDLYNTVNFDNLAVTYPQPFAFTVRSADPSSNGSTSDGRILYWYDNAGESFQAGKDTSGNAVTQHLGAAHAWIFCYDPTQNPRIRDACPSAATVNPEPIVTYRQEPIFFDMLHRIRKHAAMAPAARMSRPLFVVCTKYDAWSELLDVEFPHTPYLAVKDTDSMALDFAAIRLVSQSLRKMLVTFAPDLVTAAEGFSDQVYYLPVTAMGSAAYVDPATGRSGFRSRDLNPQWCEVPTLLALAHRSSRLIPVRDPLRNYGS